MSPCIIVEDLAHYPGLEVQRSSGAGTDCPSSARPSACTRSKAFVSRCTASPENPLQRKTRAFSGRHSSFIVAFTTFALIRFWITFRAGQYCLTSEFTFLVLDGNNNSVFSVIFANLLESMTMKQITITALIALSSSLAVAAPHEFQVQIGSSELDPSIWEGPEPVTTSFKPSHFTPSLIALYESVDIDGSKPFPFKGAVEKSGPTRISLYEVYRDTPEGTAYQDYYERFPADTDWAAVARNWEADPDNI